MILLKLKVQSLLQKYKNILFGAIRKTMIHLHNGILRSREKERAYTLCNSMDGTGEHYFK